MPIFDYTCWPCGWTGERMVKIDERDRQVCEKCGHKLALKLSAPYGRVKGRADGKVIGGPDQFTADMLGMKVKDLPEPLKAEKGKK